MYLQSSVPNRLMWYSGLLYFCSKHLFFVLFAIINAIINVITAFRMRPFEIS